jgi:hypothetical protein
MRQTRKRALGAGAILSDPLAQLVERTPRECSRDKTSAIMSTDDYPAAGPNRSLHTTTGWGQCASSTDRSPWPSTETGTRQILPAYKIPPLTHQSPLASAPALRTGSGAVPCPPMFTAMQLQCRPSPKAIQATRSHLPGRAAPHSPNARSTGIIRPLRPRRQSPHAAASISLLETRRLLGAQLIVMQWTRIRAALTD